MILQMIFLVTVGETDKEFSFNFKVENIKILPGTYDVSVSSKTSYHVLQVRIMI